MISSNIKNDKLIDDFYENIRSSKYFKVGTIIILSVAGFYILGHIFKISAHAVRGFNELRSALKND